MAKLALPATNPLAPRAAHCGAVRASIRGRARACRDHVRALNIQVLAVSLRAVVMNANHAAVIIGEHVLQFGLEGLSRLAPIPAESRFVPMRA